MTPLNPTFVRTLQDSHSSMMVDDCEINPLDADGDGYGTDVNVYPSTGNIVKGRLQDIQRIPGTPEAGDTSITIGNYIIKLPWDVDIETEDHIPTKQCQIKVNGGTVYQVQNIYKDKADRLTVAAYCYEVR